MLVVCREQAFGPGSIFHEIVEHPVAADRSDRAVGIGIWGGP